MSTPFVGRQLLLLHVLEADYRSSQSNRKEGVQLEKGSSPIKLKEYKTWLVQCPKMEVGKYILNGFRFSFHIIFQGPRVPCMSNNLKLVVGMESMF